MSTMSTTHLLIDEYEELTRRGKSTRDQRVLVIAELLELGWTGDEIQDMLAGPTKAAKRSESYYTIRSIVRGAFWLATTLIGTAVFIAAVWVLWAVIG